MTTAKCFRITMAAMMCIAAAGNSAQAQAPAPASTPTVTPAPATTATPATTIAPAKKADPALAKCVKDCLLARQAEAQVAAMRAAIPECGELDKLVAASASCEAAKKVSSGMTCLATSAQQAVLTTACDARLGDAVKRRESDAKFAAGLKALADKIKADAAARTKELADHAAGEIKARDTAIATAVGT